MFPSEGEKEERGREGGRGNVRETCMHYSVHRSWRHAYLPRLIRMSMLFECVCLNEYLCLNEYVGLCLQVLAC